MTLTIQFDNLLNHFLEHPEQIPLGQNTTNTPEFAAQKLLTEENARADHAAQTTTKSLSISLTNAQWDALDTMRNTTAHSLAGAFRFAILHQLISRKLLDKEGRAPARVGRPRKTAMPPMLQNPYQSATVRFTCPTNHQYAQMVSMTAEECQRRGEELSLPDQPAWIAWLKLSNSTVVASPDSWSRAADALTADVQDKFNACAPVRRG